MEWSYDCWHYDDYDEPKNSPKEVRKMSSDLDDICGVGAEDAESLALLQSRILDEILQERTRQIEKCKHGGDTEEFDKNNTQTDWVAYIAAYAGRAPSKVYRNCADGEEFRTNMIKVAALAMAAIEAVDKGYI